MNGASVISATSYSLTRFAVIPSLTSRSLDTGTGESSYNLKHRAILEHQVWPAEQGRYLELAPDDLGSEVGQSRYAS